MIFLDPWFWIFAAVALPCYWLCPRSAKIWWLLGASVVFHWHFAGPAGMAPIILLAVVTYAVGIGQAAAWGRRLFGATIALIVGALAFYKYSEFGAEGVADLTGLVDAEAFATALRSWTAPAAPLAISFFTFEFVHYLYEVRVHGHEPIRRPVDFALFAIFFPSLSCGPIKRFNDFVPQLQALENPSFARALGGAKRVVRGLFKKVCIADLCVEMVRVFEDVPEYTGPLVVTLAVLQGFRIYYDFAGYSDIAIGLAEMLNLRIPENFDRPYFSTSLQQFWRRWHMSLSTWIRDYVYIPLGGNRAHRFLNLLGAMLIVGLWHGAAWNFAAWGLFHGLGLGLEAAVRRLRPGWFQAGGAMRLLRWAFCYGYVSYGWLLFFYPMETVWEMTRGAIGWCLA